VKFVTEHTFEHTMLVWCSVCCGLLSVCMSICHKSELYQNGEM